MKLLTKEIEKKLPKLNSQDGNPDARVYVKFFSPLHRWTWFATEYDPDHRLFYGYVWSGIDPSFDEACYFSLDELQAVRLPFGLGIERDIHWDDTITIKEVRELKEPRYRYFKP